MALEEGTRFMVLAPIVRGRKGEYGKQLLEELRAEGFTRVKVDGELRLLEEDIVLDKKFKHDISVVVDRLVMRGRAQAAGRLGRDRGRAGGRHPRDRDVPRDGGDGEVLTFSERFACLHCGTSMPELEPRIFSFNSPHGACPRCTGLGSQMEIDPELVVPDPSLSIGEGAILPWAERASNYYDQITAGDRRALRGRPRGAVGGPARGAAGPVPLRHERRPDLRHLPQPDGAQALLHDELRGHRPNLERRYKETDSDWSREKIEEYMTMRPCPECKGARLRPESRAVKVGGMAIHEFTAMSARRALEWIGAWSCRRPSRAIARLILREIEERLRFLDNVGVGYLSMDRAAATLSGGEAQRSGWRRRSAPSLVGVLYILDEPSIGLHQRDNARLIATLERLRDLGNTVLVVEHDEGTMRAADHLIDMGPGAGEHGGTSSRRARPSEVEAEPESLTGQFLRRAAIAVPAKRRTPGLRRDQRRAQHNLKNVDVHVPLGVFCCVTGVSGSGKSTLVNEVLYKAVANRLNRRGCGRARTRRMDGLEQLDKIISVDQSPIGRTPRSNPATYIGLFDEIRDLFSKTQEARARGYKPGPLLVQRQGRPLRGLPRRRPDQDRDALPARRLRAVRAVPRQALQPRDARHPLQGQDDRRRARDADRGGARVLRAHPEDPRRLGRCTTSASATCGSASRRRRCRAARRSASSSRPSWARSRPGGRSTSSTSRRPACTSPTSRSCSRCCSAWSTRATRSW